MIWSTGAFSEEGRPLTAADLAGRKICWDGGYWEEFAANGQHLWGFGATDEQPLQAILTRGQSLSPA